MTKISRNIVRNKKTPKYRWREKKVALFKAYSKRGRRRSAISIKRSRSGTEKRWKRGDKKVLRPKVLRN